MARKKKEPIDKATKKAYLVMRFNWQYNDEYYYRPEDDPGHPQAVYSSESEARTVCRRLMVKACIKGSNPFEYLMESRNEMIFEDIVGMPFDQWCDYIRDVGVEAPSNNDGPDGPGVESLYHWWRSNTAERTWGGSSMVTNPNRWTDEQISRVAEQVRNMTYEVVEIPADPAIFPE